MDGEICTDQGLIEGCITQFYRQLYSKIEVHRPLLDDVAFSRISEEDASWLDRPFDENEVFGMEHDFDGDKAPGPDGFTMAFLQSCWSMVKTDIMNVFHAFHAHVFEKSLNATFLALIPKKVDAMDVKDFRPISLVGGLYKIIAKVLLANRMQRVVHGIIFESQNAFVKGRQILDSVLIASECIDSRLKAGVPGVLCKLDIEKVYNHVNWEFLLFLLQQCGFSDKWRRWIRCCISSVKFSILINDSPFDFFGSSRGLRQGDPLSPFLFDIVMEALSCMLVAATIARQFSGFLVGNASGSLMTVSHLLFANDTLVFCDADSNHIAALRGILSRFEEMSRLKINLGKSKLVPIGDVPDLHELVEILGL